MPEKPFLRRFFGGQFLARNIDTTVSIVFLLSHCTYLHFLSIEEDRESELDSSQESADGQGFGDISPPAKELMKLVLEEKIAHGGHPFLRWMMGHISSCADLAGSDYTQID